MPTAQLNKYGWLVLLVIAGIIGGCGPKDDKIGAEVQAKVAAAAPGATAAVSGGVVTLAGQVESEAAKTQAEQAARAIKGVKNVVNNLTVKPASVALPDQAPKPLFEADDAKIKDAVTANMTKYGVNGIDVQVQNGEVRLTGDIKRPQLQDAMKAANEAKPKKVVNQMTIK